MVRLCELRDKEVINVCDGERLGNVCDIDFDEKTGQICTLIIPGPCKVLGILGRDHEYIVPYQCVCRIGSEENNCISRQRINRWYAERGKK